MFRFTEQLYESSVRGKDGLRLAASLINSPVSRENTSKGSQPHPHTEHTDGINRLQNGAKLALIEGSDL